MDRAVTPTLSRSGRVARLVAFLAAVAMVAGVALSLLSSQASGGQLDPRDVECGAGTLGNQVLLAIELPKARGFWDHFPAALGAPELENDLSARMVVFKGDYTWFRTGEVYQHVVCVYQDNYPHIYPNVDFRGNDVGAP